ncbi:MAG TPA: D-aminoacyl-tRNA deacylase [Bryobacteraceae bacterium]|nr:D-aminoacyl-tRNA deacylase [Bryobacteraceae bacterium]
MRVLVQRVSEASVTVDGKVTGQIGTGLVVFAGFRHDDTKRCAEQLGAKIVGLRIFPDNEGKMNLNLQDIGGAMLIVSQFTLYADTRKGKRPSFSQAARPEVANALYSYFIEVCRGFGVPVATGIFQAQMKVRLTNDGPVTIMCDSDD